MGRSAILRLRYIVLLAYFHAENDGKIEDQEYNG
jgi:hypothetical protein